MRTTHNEGCCERHIRDPWTQLLLAEIKLAQGDPVAAQSLLEQVPLDFSPTEHIWGTRFKAALYLRDYDAANRVIAATPAKFVDDAFEGPSHWADGQIARARGDKQKALAAFAAAREKMEAQQGDKPKDEEYFAGVARLMLGLVEKKKRSARHAARSSSCRLPRTHNGVQPKSPTWRWFTRGRASVTARSSNSKSSRRSPETRRRHTAISASIRAGMICAVISASTRSLLQPRLPANSRHEFETRSLPCSLARRGDLCLLSR